MPRSPRTPKIHTATLRDRYILGDRAYVRVSGGNGHSIEVRVPDALRTEAAAIYGGGIVLYQYRGGRPVFASASEVR